MGPGTLAIKFSPSLSDISAGEVESSDSEIGGLQSLILSIQH